MPGEKKIKANDHFDPSEIGICVLLKIYECEGLHIRPISLSASLSSLFFSLPLWKTHSAVSTLLPFRVCSTIRLNSLSGPLFYALPLSFSQNAFKWGIQRFRPFSSLHTHSKVTSILQQPFEKGGCSNCTRSRSQEMYDKHEATGEIVMVLQLVCPLICSAAGKLLSHNTRFLLIIF